MSASLSLPVFPSIKTKLELIGVNNYKLTIEPLVPGFGHTFGNSIRRILLSSIPGFGVTAVRLNDLTHEFQPIKGVKEDAIDVVLNLKLLRAKILTNDQRATISLKITKSGKVFAKDFKKDAKIEICNPDLYICELDGTGDLEIEVDIERGIGYRNADEMESIESPNPLDILVDTLFSPVTNVSLVIDKTRVGDKTNFDKVILDFTTDGTVEVNEIIKYTFDLLIDIYQKINSSFTTSDISADATSTNFDTNNLQSEKVSQSLSETELSKRLIQILKKNNVVFITDLQSYFVNQNTTELFEFSGMSEKYIDELKDFATLQGWS